MRLHNAKSGETVWVYALVTLCILLSIAILTVKCWRRPLKAISQKYIPCLADRQRGFSQALDDELTPGSRSLDSFVLVGSHSTEQRQDQELQLSNIKIGVTSSHPTIPLQTDPAMFVDPASTELPQAAERVQFAQPGKFQLRK
jgi:hypothetical protein